MEENINEKPQEEMTGTEVLIDGKMIPLTGGDTEYIRKVAAYINGKMEELRNSRQYARQSAENRSLLLWLNLADDVMKAREEAEALKNEAEAHGAEVYTLKRELVERRLESETLTEKLTKERSARKDAELKLQPAEQRAKDAEQRLQEAEQRAKDAEQRLQEAEQRAEEAEQKLQEAEQRAEGAEQQAAKLTSDLNDLLSR